MRGPAVGGPRPGGSGGWPGPSSAGPYGPGRVAAGSPERSPGRHRAESSSSRPLPAWEPGVQGDRVEGEAAMGGAVPVDDAGDRVVFRGGRLPGGKSCGPRQPRPTGRGGRRRRTRPGLRVPQHGDRVRAAAQGGTIRGRRSAGGGGARGCRRGRSAASHVPVGLCAWSSPSWSSRSGVVPSSSWTVTTASPTWAADSVAGAGNPRGGVRRRRRGVGPEPGEPGVRPPLQYGPVTVGPGAQCPFRGGITTGRTPVRVCGAAAMDTASSRSARTPLPPEGFIGRLSPQLPRRGCRRGPERFRRVGAAGTRARPPLTDQREAGASEGPSCGQRTPESAMVTLAWVLPLCEP